MTFTIEQRDLFTVPQGYYLAHCISGDFALGAGIAKRFDEVYNMRFKLFRDFDEGCVGEATLVDNVFNLVVKEKKYDNVLYVNLESALIDMRDTMEYLNIDKLAMPKICCGREGLDWDLVKKLIKEVFENTNVNILICEL
jgi:hypothetical protein